MTEKETKDSGPHDHGNAKNRVSFRGKRMSIIKTDLPDTVALCPFFTGTAGKNMALFKQRRASSGLSGLDIDGVTLNEEDDTITFSYTKPSMEFPENIKENDLFSQSNSSTHGYFTREHGYMIPDYEASLQDLLKSRGRLWLTMGRRMAGLMMNNGLIQAVDEMEIIEADEIACPDSALQIASCMLGNLTNGYRAACGRNNVEYQPAPALEIPWKKISERLHRKDVYFSVEDWLNLMRPIRGNDYSMENCEIQAPIYGSVAERCIISLFAEAGKHAANMVEPILALCRGDWGPGPICKLINEVKGLTKMLAKAIPDKNAGIYSVDPVEFGTAFVNATSPLKEDVPALSGAAVPVFAIMDHVIGRTEWNTLMGVDLLMQIEWMPKNWRRYMEYIRQSRIFEKVPDDLQYLWTLLKDEYCGERGWLGFHKYRAYQYVELAGALGRASNKGSSSGEGTLKMLEESRQERDPTISSDRGSYKTCHFKGKIESVIRVSEDRLTKLVTICSSKPIYLHVGDHIAVVMNNNDDNIWKYATATGLDLKTSLSISDGTLNQEWKERLDFGSLDYTVYNVLLCAKLARVPGGSLNAETVCKTLLPEEPRLYSYGTPHPHHCETDASIYEFNLLVTKTVDGGCSAFLFEAVGQTFCFGISTSSKFHTPRDTTTPIVVIAAGSGLGTFLPLLFNDNIPNPKYAFLAFRTENTVPFLDTHFKNAVSYGKLKLFIEFSREETTLITVNRKFVRQKTEKRYINKLLHQEAALIHELAHPVGDGGLGAYVYVCGNNEFFNTVRKGMTLGKPCSLSLQLLIGESRLHLEVQARGTRGEKQVKKTVTLGEMCFHNKPNDFWVAINGVVYDFTRYLSWHPGGRKILHYVAGTDCSKYWDLVSHSRDRMIYSQLSAYEIGLYENTDESGLSGYLETVTRYHNAVNLYMDKEEAFENFCDSYTRIQGIVEGVFGQEFVEHVMSLIPDRKQFGSVLARVWMVKHGGERVIANRLFKIVPSGKTKETVAVSGINFFDLDLRSVSQEERVQLGERLTRACTTFFIRCKKTLAEAVAHKDMTTAAYTRMFFRLGCSFEEFYNALATPLPLKEIRGWNIIKEEMYQRKTFLMRFKTLRNAVSADFETLTSSIPPSEGSERDAFIDKVLDSLEVDKIPTYRVESELSEAVIHKWYTSEKLRDVFKQLDVDADGLISKEDLQGFLSQDENTQKILEGFEALMVEDEQKSTYSLEDVLSVSTVIA